MKVAILAAADAGQTTGAMKGSEPARREVKLVFLSNLGTVTELLGRRGRRQDPVLHRELLLHRSPHRSRLGDALLAAATLHAVKDPNRNYPSKLGATSNQTQSDENMHLADYLLDV